MLLKWFKNIIRGLLFWNNLKLFPKPSDILLIMKVRGTYSRELQKSESKQTKTTKKKGGKAEDGRKRNCGRYPRGNLFAYF